MSLPALINSQISVCCDKRVAITAMCIDSLLISNNLDSIYETLVSNHMCPLVVPYVYPIDPYVYPIGPYVYPIVPNVYPIVPYVINWN